MKKSIYLISRESKSADVWKALKQV